MDLDNVEDLYPLSPVQQGMLFHALTAPSSGVYIGQYTCKLQGNLNPEYLRQAWQHVLDRHTALRTIFVWELDEPLQIVRQQVELPWCEVDWCDRPNCDLDTFLEADRTQGFDLDRAPLMRLTLIRLAAATYRLVWTCHHLLTDGWSTPLIWHEIYELYDTFGGDRNPVLPAPHPYRDYIAWLQERDWQAARQFWTTLLKGFSAPTPLPGESGISDAPISSVDRRSHRLSPEFTVALRAFGRRHRLTLSTLLNGAWALLLHRYSGEKDIVFGVVVSGRSADIPDIETRIGLFINTLPVRVAIAPSTDLISWLQSLQRQTLDARAYETTPLSDIQAWCDMPTGQNLFNSLVVFENQPAAFQKQALDFEVSDIDSQDQSNYPLVLLVLPGETLELRLIGDRDRVSDDIRDRLLVQLETMLQGFIESPQATLNDIPLLSAPERQQLLFDWNQTQSPLPQEACIHHLIAAQAERTPENIAIAFDSERLTYRDLDRRANQLAHHLRSLGIAATARVGICLERSLDAIVAILAVHKAGGAYVPLDPAYPRDRLAFMVEDADINLLITQQAWLGVLPAKTDRVLCLDNCAEAIAAAPTFPLDPATDSPDAEAYVIYTSGSTGQPKGVSVSHRNLVHSTSARLEYYPEVVRSFLLLSSFSFDSSVAGIFWTLCQGGTLVLPRQHLEQDLRHLAHLIATHDISHTLCLPTLYALLLADAAVVPLQSLRVVIVAGEACPRSLPRQHYAVLPQAALYNEYGPTEATVWCSAYRIPSEVDPRLQMPTIPIGKPIPNTQIYLLDEELRPVPIGAPGELYVGGAGITQGYLNRPEQTQMRFVANPFGGDRLYRTGDMARYRPDGNLEWLGRRDRQIKIRGHRIELGEIEDVLRQHPDVREAVVMATESKPLVEPNLDEDIERLVAQLMELEPARVEELLAAIVSQPVEPSA